MAFSAPSSRSTYTRLPEAEALLPAQQPASTADVETGKQKAHAQLGDAPAPQGGSGFEMACPVVPNGVVRGLGTCLTLVLASVYALFSVTGMMAGMMVDSLDDTSQFATNLVNFLVVYWVLGGLVAATFCCAFAILSAAGPRSPWYMRYTLNMAPALAHFLGIVLLVCLFTAIAR